MPDEEPLKSEERKQMEEKMRLLREKGLKAMHTPEAAVKRNLKNHLIERSLEIKVDVEKLVRELKVPMSVQDIVYATHSNRITIQRVLTEVLAKNKYPVAMTRIGMSDILYRTDVPDFQDKEGGEADSTETGNDKEAAMTQPQ